MVREVDRSSVDELLRAIAPSKVAEALGIRAAPSTDGYRCTGAD